MTGAKSIKYFHFGAFYTWKSIIAGLSSFGESKAFIFLDAVHVRINGESGCSPNHVNRTNRKNGTKTVFKMA